MNGQAARRGRDEATCRRGKRWSGRDDAGAGAAAGKPTRGVARLAVDGGSGSAVAESVR